MNAIIYVTAGEDISIYDKYNECARYAKRHGHSIESRMLDFEGTEFYKAVGKVVFGENVDAIIVYDLDGIGDHETALFYRIYMNKFGKELIFCS